MPAGGNSRFRGYPARMSERQQLALILQMTSQEMTSGPSGRSESSHSLSNARASPLQHQKSSKSRWSKNADLLDVNTSFNRQDERLRLVNGCDTKERNEFAGSNSPDEVRTASGAESPVAAGSPAECAATAIPSAVASVDQDKQQQQLVSSSTVSGEDKQSSSSSSSSQAEDAATAATYEMRRTPPQNKVDRQSSGGGSGNNSGQQQQQTGGGNNNSGGSGGGGGGGGGGGSAGGGGSGGSGGGGSSSRVTLRLNQVRATRDEKKGGGGGGGGGGGTGGATVSGTSGSGGSAGGGGISASNAAPGQANASTRTSASATVASASSSSMNSSQMEATTTKGAGSGGPTSTSAGTNSSSGAISGSGAGGNNAGNSNTNNSSSSSSADSGDVYEFKSSKEATPVRGSSSSPNPNPDKDGKDAVVSSLSSTSGGNQGHNTGGNTGVSGSTGAVGSSTSSSSAVASSTSGNAGVGSSSSASGNTASSSAEALASSAATSMSDEPMMTTSPQSSSGSAPTSSCTKRAFDSENSQADEQDEEVRKRKKKETEPGKEIGGAKGTAGRGQAAARNNPSIADKCVKSGKQAAGAISTKGGQSSTSVNTDRKSPSSSLNANSPKPSNSSSGSAANNPKGNIPSATESDGEDERSKNSDCSSAPKVPPLKIVIPQSTTSEQEQGNRNGKNTSNRGHQLPYVVASSNSNDSMDKDQSMSAATSGTTSPLDSTNAASKNDEKKDFSGALDNESRSTSHHQRVLRSSHRSGNGGNGNPGTRENPGSLSGNGNYSNSSPLPANAADRSNNSSPQQRHHSPTPESSGVSEAGKSVSTDSPIQNSPATKSGNPADKCEKTVEVKKEAGDVSDSGIKKESGTEGSSNSNQAPVELHPRKRKMKPSKEAQQAAATAAANETTETTSTGPEIHPHDQPITNCYQLYLNIRKQIERRRKGLFPVQPKPPQGFKDYLMNRCTYVLAGNANKEPNINPPVNLMGPMKDLYIEQEKERYRLRMQHVVEKEKLVLSVEQEILRVHGRAARALANQSLPFSVCTILKDEEVYNVITPEQEEKDRNARSRYNGRLFLSWLQDVDDKWEKIKESMLLRHHNEAESLHAVQRMDWEWKLKEVGLCEFKVTPQIEDLHVPMVHVSDDFDLLPA